MTGVNVESDDSRLIHYPASSIVLATGGVGQLYRVTTNPLESKGLGLAIAARAGAIISDAEFVQFHPTAIDVGRDPAPLATEALRGEGAILQNTRGERFMLSIHPDAELAPRDIVARAVFSEVQAGRGAYLDCRSAIGSSFKDKIPTVYASCISAGIDPATDLMPIIPAEHYHMGGVATDARGRTSLEGLWAAGEVASTGVHGANRLASNSLLEAVVFAARIAEDVADHAMPEAGSEKVIAENQSIPDELSLVMQLRTAMAQHVGVLRNRSGLLTALAVIARVQQDAQSHGLKNMAIAALMITTSALARHESRGGHFRTDFPLPDPALAKRSHFTLHQACTIAEEAAC